MNAQAFEGSVAYMTQRVLKGELPPRGGDHACDVTPEKLRAAFRPDFSRKITSAVAGLA